MSKKILHAYHRLSFGGAEMRLLDAITELRTIGSKLQIDVLSVSGSAGDLDENIKQLGSKVHYIRYGVLFPIKFAKIIRQERYDVFHCNLRLLAGPLLMLAYLCGIKKRIVHYRSADDYKQLTTGIRWGWLVSRLMVRFFATEIIAVSEAAMSNHMGNDWTKDQRCSILYNGVRSNGHKRDDVIQSVRQEFGIPSSAPMIVHVGNFRWQKNHERLIEIAARLKEEYGDFRLLLVGDNKGNTEAESICNSVRNYIHKYGIGGNIIMAGSRSDSHRIILASDLMVSTSVCEGLPGAVLESLMYGTPVVCSDIRPFREIASIVPNISIVPLEADNSVWVREISEGLQIADRAQRASMVKKFSESPFTIKSHVSRLEKLYYAELPKAG